MRYNVSLIPWILKNMWKCLCTLPPSTGAVSIQFKVDRQSKYGMYAVNNIRERILMGNTAKESAKHIRNFNYKYLQNFLENIDNNYYNARSLPIFLHMYIYTQQTLNELIFQFRKKRECWKTCLIDAVISLMHQDAMIPEHFFVASTMENCRDLVL